mmetsp:Transcript_2145/g.4683  ORF Transcript_2145/g.4683 Transcript_2145/m.4683 type:complete len:205 (-) Transcript_2145:397-1011(-)
MYASRITRLVQQCVALHTVKYRRRPQGQCRRVMSETLVETMSGGLHANHLDIIFVKKGCKKTQRIATTSDACQQAVGHTSCKIFELLFCFKAYHGLEVTHHHGKGVRAYRRSNGKEHGLWILHEGPERGIDGFFERSPTFGGGDHFGTKYLHASDIGPLLFNIDFTHMNFTTHFHQGRRRSQGDSVLSSTCFGNECLFAHFLGQ